MKDLIAKLQMDANCALGAIWMHIDAQAARIAELEAQIAAGFEPVVGQQPYIYAHKSMFEIRGEHHCIHAYKTADDTFNVPLYLAPQPAGTDKLREAIRNVEISTSGSKGYFKAWNEGAEHMRDAILDLVASTALQAPVREVPGWISCVDQMPETGQLVLIIEKYMEVPCIASHDGNIWNADQAYYDTYASYGPGAILIDKINQEYVSHWMPLPISPVLPKGGDHE